MKMRFTNRSMTVSSFANGKNRIRVRELLLADLLALLAGDLRLSCP
jgi:hypothetical protein